jgi:hypothetical protein
MKRSIERLSPMNEVDLFPMNQEERIAFGHLHDRILHVAEAPRVAKALSYDWDMSKIEDEYLGKPPGIIYIDRLLSDEAMAKLRAYCLESTFWNSAHYDAGYMGALFTGGFYAPLLFQIAEELAAAMPRVIGKRPLHNLWAYKYDQELTGIKLHADAALVNVNFWITPDDANLDPEHGGLVVYDKEAPQSWDFSVFNGPLKPIEAFLAETKANMVRIPYRQNRAVIFNSDLFHATDEIHFKPGYENRRINVTFLFGERGEGK